MDAESLALVPTSRGTLLQLAVRPGARASKILGVHGGSLRVSVAAPPERGRANQAALELLADTLGILPSALRLVTGTRSRTKTVLVPLHPQMVVGRLARAVAERLAASADE